MDISLLFCIVLALTAFIVFFNDIFPTCDLCKKTKPRNSFKLLIRNGIGLSRRHHASVCRKCCSRYFISTYDDYKNVKDIRSHVKADI